MKNRIPKGNPLKILILHRPSGYGGAEVYLSNLVLALVDDGMDVNVCFGYDGVVLPNDFERNLISYGANIININFDPIHYSGISNFKNIWEWLGNINPDLVLIDRMGNWLSYSKVIFVSRIRNYRVITVEHMDFNEWPKLPAHKYLPTIINIRKLLKKIRFHFIANLINTIICVNQAAYHRFVHEYGLPKHIVHLIYHGVDIKNFEFNINSRYEWREKLGLVDENIMIISVSRHSQEKGMDILLESIAILPDSQQKKVVLILVGNGPEHIALKQLAIKLKIIAQIKFLGERYDIPQLLSASDLFVCPSREESFGLAIAEAMAAARCIIASNVGGIPELLNRSGILVTPEAPIELSQVINSLVDNESLRNEFGNQALIRVNDFFNINKSMHETIKRIKDVCQS